MHRVTQDEAIARLPQLIDQAARDGEEVLVMRDHTAVAKIVPLVIGSAVKPRAQFGSAKGQIHMRENFDSPLEDFKEYM